MAVHHEPLKALSPVEWASVPQDDLQSYLSDIFSDCQTIVDSIPVPAATLSSGRARAKTDSAVPLADLNMALSRRLDGEAVGHAQQLLKEWKEVKVNAKENPLAINVYRLPAKDGKGTWFARKSVHHGITFDKWKKALEREFAETMKVQSGPGKGTIRGIGAEKRVELIDVPDTGKLQGARSRELINYLLITFPCCSLSTVGTVPWTHLTTRLYHSPSYIRF